MKGLLVLLMLSVSLSGLAKDKNICFFSFNNKNEVLLADEFIAKINPHGDYVIRLKEFQEDDEDPNVMFSRAAESGTQCDGVVISGHHTGSWGGERAYGELHLNHLEELSCNTRAGTAEWFKNVKAVWLQGCRTLGVGKVPQNKSHYKMYSADYHTLRVYSDLYEDSLEMGLSSLSRSYTMTLDQQNSMADRYLKVFPQAQVYGWTETAPGVKAKSENSILYHISHRSALNGVIGAWNPMDEKREPVLAAYHKALSQILEGDQKVNGRSNIQSWINHGKGVDKPGLRSYSINEVSALNSIAGASRSDLGLARDKACQIKNSQYSQEAYESIRDALESEVPMEQLFDDIWTSVLDFRYHTATAEEEYLDLLRSSAKLVPYFENRMKSNQVGSLEKIQYYGIFKKLYPAGLEHSRIKQLLIEQMNEILAQPVPSEKYQDFNDRIRYKLRKTGISL